ncbi:MBL fold metallo-hydrolase, partial [Mycolicibacterium elephantis]|uniref:MBL fold metallo-hydrolase n=1 Tax=Mycolicibacterium elephantis TaxID=81858 RepID=UPI000AB7D2E9
MELTHFGHSCLLAKFTKDSGSDTTVLFDPGVFSHGFEGITGLSAILITHQHPDHADTQRLPALLDANPQAALYADPQTAAQLGEPWQAVHVGDELQIGHLTVRGAGVHQARRMGAVADHIGDVVDDGDLGVDHRVPTPGAAHGQMADLQFVADVHGLPRLPE